MNVLSLFDGMSCGQIALNSAGIDYDNYFASEIDKWAIKVTQSNYPNTIQIGSVVDVKPEELPKIDLLIGGSPCQGFSFAGKQLNFEDPRSKLFFEYVRVLKGLKEKNPNIKFFLENVKMKKEYLDEISRIIGVEPIFVNSNLVSAQNRKRYYWTNIDNFETPKDRGILLKDILEEGYVDREKSFCVDANYAKGGNLKSYYKKHRRQLVFGAVQRGKYDDNKKVYQKMEVNGVEKSNCLTSVQKDPMVAFGAAKRNQVTKDGTKPFLNVLKEEKSNCVVGSFTARNNGVVFIRQKGRGFNKGGDHYEKSPTMTKNSWQTNHEVYDGYIFRRLSVKECERLQTVPDDYTKAVSNSQRYKMLGNGWTVDVIVEFFKNLKS